jgi:hypothetical protein
VDNKLTSCLLKHDLKFHWDGYFISLSFFFLFSESPFGYTLKNSFIQEIVGVKILISQDTPHMHAPLSESWGSLK